MIKRMSIYLMLAVMLAVSAVAVQAKSKVVAEDSGYKIELSSSTIDLVFPDGSVLFTPKDFDGQNLNGVSASGGMALELLQSALKQMGQEVGSAELPKAFALGQNFPNPFNPSTTIKYDIPEGSSDQQVRLSVYNIRGQKIRTLVDRLQGPGSYNVNWDGSDQSGRNVSSGVYFYRIEAGTYNATRKMVILK